VLKKIVLITFLIHNAKTMPEFCRDHAARPGNKIHNLLQIMKLAIQIAECGVEKLRENSWL